MHFYTSHALSFNDKSNNDVELFNTDKDLNAWSWWLVNKKNQSFDITHFSIPETSKYKIDNEELKENVMEIVLYIKGR